MSAGGDYKERLSELRDTLFGPERASRLRGEVIVDQVYAHYQHERLDLRHPRGGGALYLQKPMFASFRHYLGDIARTMLEDGGREGMRRSMEDLAGDGGVKAHAPFEFGDLRRSGHPRVLLDDRVIFDRDPEQHRLSEAELRIKARLRKLPPELIGYIWWHVMHNTEPPPHLGGRRW